MTTEEQIEESDELDETIESEEKKPKVDIRKSITPKFGASFPSGHTFRGNQSGNMNNNRQRPWRAANRGR